MRRLKGMRNQMKQLYSALRHLTPFDVAPYAKIRVGPNGDGGYVLLDNFRPGQTVVSVGIGASPFFDLAMAHKGLRVYMFDHTIEGVENLPDSCIFMREGVSGEDKPDALTFSLQSIVNKSNPFTYNMILKMDIEGAEWEVLSAVSRDLLMRFEQLTFEFHGLHSICSGPWGERIVQVLEKINHDFTLFHVHANNYAEIQIVAGFPICQVLEVSYVRSDLITRARSKTIYPTPLDSPNNRSRMDHPLLFFPFAPMNFSGDNDALERMISRIAS
jgi:hypothetical protein